jgi:Large polyvalent protein associated domain 39
MLTTLATSAEDVTGPNFATRALQDTGQGIIDRNPAGVRKLADIIESPWLAAREAVGQLGPQIAAAGAGGLAGAKAGRTLGSIAGPVGAAAGAAIGGVAGSLAPIFTQEYGGIRQEQQESGQEDKARALAAAIPATALERIGMGQAMKVVKGVGLGPTTVLKEAGKGVLKEGATEGAQNMIEQWGAFKDPREAENLEDSAFAAAMGGIGGGVMGGASGAVDHMRQRGRKADTQPDVTEDIPGGEAAPDSPPEGRAAMSNAATPSSTESAAPGSEPTPATAPPLTPSQAMGIDPAAGPLSKAAAASVDLSLEPIAAPVATQLSAAEIDSALYRLPAEQQRQAELIKADLANQALPPSVRAFRQSELTALAKGAPPIQQELGPEDMPAAPVLAGYDARQRAENSAGSAPRRALALEPLEAAQYENSIEFDQPAPVASEISGRIAELAAAQSVEPGAAMRLNEAHAIRRRAADEGLPLSVVPHPSGRGYDVQPSALLTPEQQRSTAPEGQGALPFDSSLSGRMIAGDGSVRAESRSEAVARRNAEQEERAVLETRRQQRTGLGLSNYTPIQPLTLERGQAMPPALEFDNGPTGRMIGGQDGLRQERRAEVVNRAQRQGGGVVSAAAPASVSAAPAQAVTRINGTPFLTESAAQQALERKGLEATHQVVPAGGDPSLGYIGQPISTTSTNGAINGDQTNQTQQAQAQRSQDRAAQAGQPVSPEPQVAADTQRREYRDAERKRTAPGRTLRANAEATNPMRAFLGKHGVVPSVRRDFAPGAAEQRAAMVPGFGPIFRKSGKQLDQLAQAAYEEGFIRSPDAVQQLEDLMHRAMRNERVIAQYRPEQVDAEMQSRIARQQALEEDAAVSSIEQLDDATLFALEDADVVFDGPSNMSAEDAMRALGFTEQEIQNELTQQPGTAQEDGPGRGRADEVAPGQAQASTATRDGAARPAAQPEASSFRLTSPTRADLVAREEAQRQNAANQSRSETESQRRAQADAERDSFALTGSDRAADVQAAQGQQQLGDGTGMVFFNSTGESMPERGLSLEQAQKAVNDALAGLINPPPVDVVLRAGDLGQGIPDYVKGVRKPNGQLAVVAGAHSSPLDVIETVFHELFHHGLRNVVPDADYVQTMLDLAKRDPRVQEYANQWKRDAPEATQQREELRNLGFSGSELNGRYEALAIEEGLAVVAEELRAQKQAGTRLGLRVRTLANWLASVADKMGMKRLANTVRNMTYNQAERFVLSAIEHSGDAVAARNSAGDVSRFRSRGDTPVGQRVGDALKSVTVTNIKQQAGFKATDLRPLSLQMLGRRQLVDVYGDMLPEMRTYNDLMARMDADKNEAGAGADQLAKDWEKLKDENALADLMHDSTLAQMDPAKDYVQGDNRVRYVQLRKRYEALSPEAQGVYQRARDIHRNHMRDVRAAIKERIERSEMGSERKAAMLKRMDDEFFGHIKGVYFPLARFGQYVVVVKDAEGKVANVSRAETMREADTTRSQLAQAFPAAKGFTVGKVLKGKEFVADRDTVGRGFMEQLYGVLDKQGMEPKQRAELEDALGQLYLSSLPDLSWAKHGIHRKGTAGFSQDARRAFAQNVFHGASYLAKLRYGDQLQDQLSEMQRRADEGVTDPGFDSVKAQQVIDEMAKRHDAAMNPKSNAVSTALTSLGFIFYLGLSPASAMVNLSQTALVAYPVMGAKWGFSKSGAALLKASQETMRGKNDITSSLNADEKAAFDEAVRSGVVDVTMAHDLAGIAQGEDQKVTNSMRRWMRAASWMFHHAEKFNRQVTFVAAYRLARETGADSKSAYSQAVQATYDGHFDYSANNRPRFMQGNWQKVLLLFKQYSQNMVYTFVRNAQQSLKGATPEVRAEARKTLAGLLTSHAMAAGVLGLPMVTTLLAAASMLGGDDDEPWDAQVALQNMLADSFGQKPAEVLSHGLSRLTPWDISGRVGLDKLIFPDVQEGLEGQRLGEAAMTAALGPVAAIAVNGLKGLQDMSHGQYQRGLESMMPTALRGPLKAWRYNNEGVKDKSGIVIQDEVDAAAFWGQAAGFSPSETRNAFEGKSAVISHDRALMTRRRTLVEQFAMAAMSKDEEGKAEARAAIAKFNDKNPERRIQPMQLAQSVRNREKRIREAEDGVYLPRKRRDALDIGRFSTGE